jgi:hypothetical protein
VLWQRVLGEASVQVVMWQQFIIWENQVYGLQYVQSFEMGEDLVEWTGSMSFQLYFHTCRSVCISVTSLIVGSMHPLLLLESY